MSSTFILQMQLWLSADVKLFIINNYRKSQCDDAIFYSFTERSVIILEIEMSLTTHICLRLPCKTNIHFYCKARNLISTNNIGLKVCIIIYLLQNNINVSFLLLNLWKNNHETYVLSMPYTKTSIRQNQWFKITFQKSLEPGFLAQFEKQVGIKHFCI